MHLDTVCNFWLYTVGKFSLCMLSSGHACVALSKFSTDNIPILTDFMVSLYQHALIVQEIYPCSQWRTCTPAKSSVSGWGDSGWDEDSWGDPFADVQPSKSQTGRGIWWERQEERRKRQEAAWLKQAAGIGSHPKLGAKSDWHIHGMCMQLTEYLCTLNLIVIYLQHTASSIF